MKATGLSLFFTFFLSALLPMMVYGVADFDQETMNPPDDFLESILEDHMTEKAAGSLESPLEPETKTTSLFTPNYFFYFLSFIAVLLLVIWGSRLVSKFGRMGGRHLKLVESLYFGPNRGLHLVQVGKRIFLVGCSDRYLRMLTEIKDPDLLAAVDEGRASVTRGFTGKKGFLDFSSYLQKFQKITPLPVEEKEVSGDLPQVLGDKLNELRERRFKPENDDE